MILNKSVCKLTFTKTKYANKNTILRRTQKVDKTIVFFLERNNTTQKKEKIVTASKKEPFSHQFDRNASLFETMQTARLIT